MAILLLRGAAVTHPGAAFFLEEGTFEQGRRRGMKCTDLPAMRIPKNATQSGGFHHVRHSSDFHFR